MLRRLILEVLALGLLFGATSCNSFGPPSPALLEKIGALPTPSAPGLSRQIILDVESPALSGTFDGVLVARTRSPSAVRLQLFPDVGGKVLDLAVNSNAITAIPAEGEIFHTELPPKQRLARSLPLLFAVTLIEHFTPLTRERIIGARSWNKRGWELKLVPHPTGVEVRVFLDEYCQVVARSYRYGLARWRLTCGEPLRIKAWRLEASIETDSEEPMDEIPDSLFVLEHEVAP